MLSSITAFHEGFPQGNKKACSLSQEGPSSVVWRDHYAQQQLLQHLPRPIFDSFIEFPVQLQVCFFHFHKKKKTSQRLELDNCIPRNYNLLHQDYGDPCAVNSHLNLPLSPRDSTTSSATPFISHASLNNRILLIRMSVLILAGIIHF